MSTAMTTVVAAGIPEATSVKRYHSILMNFYRITYNFCEIPLLEIPKKNNESCEVLSKRQTSSFCRRISGKSSESHSTDILFIFEMLLQGVREGGTIFTFVTMWRETMVYSHDL